MRKVARLGCLLAGVIQVGALGGCSTVLFSEDNSAARTAAIEREALIDAAETLSRTSWPEPENVSWQARIVHIGADRVSKSDAVEIYLASLGETGDRYSKVLRDAEAHLRAADDLALAAANAAQSVRPVMDDVSIVEEAIGDLRQTRDIYVESLKALAKLGEPAPSPTVRELKSGFDTAIKTLGAVADELADRIADDDTETFAGPAQHDQLVEGSLYSKMR